MKRFPQRVFIDDQCDACGNTHVLGVLFGVGKPVLCAVCLARAHAVVTEAPPSKGS